MPFKGTAETLAAVGVSPRSAISGTFICAPARVCGILVLSPGKGSVLLVNFFSPVPGFSHARKPKRAHFLCPDFVDMPLNRAIVCEL